jgi:hypothetical protein
MALTAVVCSVVGALLATAVALWLLLGFNPMGKRYLTVEGGGFGHIPTVATGVRLLLKDQSKAAAMAALGAALQLAGVVLGLFAAAC